MESCRFIGGDCCIMLIKLVCRIIPDYLLVICELTVNPYCMTGSEAANEGAIPK